MRWGSVALIASAALFATVAAAQPSAWQWNLPDGVVPPPVSADNPMSQAKVDLGRRLFYDADLSLDGTMACANCHGQHNGFADSIPTRAGVHGDPGLRNAPGLANIAYLSPLNWADPGVATLEQQAHVPLFGESPVEMGMTGQDAELARRLSGNDCYIAMFRAAFPETQGRIDTEAVTKALAAFQRGMISFDSPADRYARGERSALSPAARRGEAVFRANCASCHSGDNFTDGLFHAIAPAVQDNRDPGLATATGDQADRGRFRTPSLRNVALTPPYMHDGSAETLAEAIARHSHAVPRAAMLASSDGGQDLIAFLDALTDRGFVNDPALSYPDGICENYTAAR